MLLLKESFFKATFVMIDPLTIIFDDFGKSSRRG